MELRSNNRQRTAHFVRSISIVQPQILSRQYSLEQKQTCWKIFDLHIVPKRNGPMEIVVQALNSVFLLKCRIKRGGIRPPEPALLFPWAHFFLARCASQIFSSRSVSALENIVWTKFGVGRWKLTGLNELFFDLWDK